MEVGSLLKNFLLLLAGVFIGMLIAFFVYVEYLSPQTLSLETVRTSKPEKIYVEYVAYACGGECARLTEIYQDSNGKEILAKTALYTHFPSDIENPENTKLALNGNRFILTAYREIKMEVNQQYQDLQEFTNHVYVVEWEAITPYSIWKKGSPPVRVTKEKTIKQVSQLIRWNRKLE